MTTTRHQLVHLARAYFHQDYALEASNPMNIVRLFKQGEPPDAVAELISDVESILNSSMSEDEIRNLWINEYGASYDPLMDDIAYRTWFADVLSTLTSASQSS